MVLATGGVVISLAGSWIVSSAILSEAQALAVSDTGHGTSPDVLDHILDPFFTMKDERKGTGLGLSIAYRLVSKHGGNIAEPEIVADGGATTLRPAR